ncbi:MAG TPA: alpha/beta hydrolase [Clostridiales bacterium]|nr:alpha/beta hydrolase [Clostridiales bacterium]
MKKETFPLWKNGAPRQIAGGEVPMMTYYAAKNKTHDGTVVIFPGGGYEIRAPHEGDGYARFLNDHGFDAFVVDYRVSPNRFPTELLDARRAVRLVRENAAKYGISPDKIAVMGSSAGGHLAALVSTYRPAIDGEGADKTDEVSPFPNASILCYPVIDTSDDAIVHMGSKKGLLGEENTDLGASVSPAVIADRHTCPAFLWHTSDDACVNVINSYRYATRLRTVGVPVEMHILPHGPHGMGLADTAYGCNADTPYIARWGEWLVAWLSELGF